MPNWHSPTGCTIYIEPSKHLDIDTSSSPHNMKLKFYCVLSTHSEPYSEFFPITVDHKDRISDLKAQIKESQRHLCIYGLSLWKVSYEIKPNINEIFEGFTPQEGINATELPHAARISQYITTRGDIQDKISIFAHVQGSVFNAYIVFIQIPPSFWGPICPSKFRIQLTYSPTESPKQDTSVDIMGRLGETNQLTAIVQVEVERLGQWTMDDVLQNNAVLMPSSSAEVPECIRDMESKLIRPRGVQVQFYNTSFFVTAMLHTSLGFINSQQSLL